MSISDELPPLPKLPPNGTRCNARKRNSRGYCPSRPYLGGNGRCYFHGGPSLSGLATRLTMGKRANYLPPELQARYEDLTGDSVDGLEENVRMQQAMESQLWSQLETGESHQAWKVLNDLVAQWEFADEQTQTGIFLRIKMIAEGGLKAYGVKKEILDLQERQRKQTETLTKCRKEIQETYTQESWNQMLGQVLRILKLRCDTETLRQIAIDIQNEGLERGGTNTNGKLLVAPVAVGQGD
jgi:hypothetical protein